MHLTYFPSGLQIACKTPVQCNNDSLEVFYTSQKALVPTNIHQGDITKFGRGPAATNIGNTLLHFVIILPILVAAIHASHKSISELQIQLY